MSRESPEKLEITPDDESSRKVFKEQSEYDTLPIATEELLDIDRQKRIEELKSELKPSLVTSSQEKFAVENKSNFSTDAVIEAVYDILSSHPKNPKIASVRQRLRKLILPATLAATTIFALDFGLSNEVEKEKIEHVSEDIGINLSALEKEAEIKVSVPIYNEHNQHYLLHIGQGHHAFSQSTDEVKKVIGSQKKVEIVLDHLHEIYGSGQAIFLEGITNQEEIIEICGGSQELLDEFVKLGSYRGTAENYDENLIPTINSFLETSATILSNSHDDKEPYQLQKEVAFAYLGEKVLKIIENLEQSSDKDLLQSLDQESFKVLSKHIKKEQKALSSGCYGDITNWTLYILGAGTKEYLDGKFQILPTEGKVFAQIEGKTKELEEEAHETKWIWDRMKVANKYRALEKDMMSGRERESVQMLSSTLDKKSPKVVPLVFGSAHDFSEEVTEYDNHHPELGLNLIKINTTL